MRAFLRAAALTVAAVAVLASWLAVGVMSGEPVRSFYEGSGIHLAYRDGQVVVGSVAPGSAGERYGIQPGWVVTELNGVELYLVGAGDLPALAQRQDPIQSIGLIPAGATASGGPAGEPNPYPYVSNFSFVQYTYPPNVDVGQMSLGLLVLIGGWWLLRTGRLGPALQPYAVTLPVATAMPLLLVPLDMYATSLSLTAVWTLLIAGSMPLAFSFAWTLPSRRPAVLLSLGILALAGAALGMSGLYVMADRLGAYWYPLHQLYEPIAMVFGSPSFLLFVFVVLMTVVPGVLALMPLVSERPVGEDAGADDASEAPAVVRSPRFAGSLDLALGAITPAVAGITLLSSSHDTYPIVLWLVGLLVARRFGVQPLVRLVQRTSRQRDLVMTATERERARIASDIHDYALQDLTMLVRRLDAAGDVENATAAREVADRLRAICGDLRLPILDDLGVGPALDWLVDRLEPDRQRLELELSDRELRLTPDAELAFFRVAQEAIANAIHHGAPPISVRYRGGGDWAELIVDDCGPGIAAGAAEAAERTGHMGLMSMSQRAEAIGAELAFGRRPGGGARVHMTWERRGAIAEPMTEPMAAAKAGDAAAAAAESA